MMVDNNTVWFYYSDLISNYVSLGGLDLPCKGEMVFTGDKGFQPWNIWYDFANFGTHKEPEWTFTFRYNEQTSTFPCDGVEYNSDNHCNDYRFTSSCSREQQIFKTMLNVTNDETWCISFVTLVCD